MDAKSEAVMKSSSSTVASETSTSKSSTSVVVSKKAISSEKVVASKLITSGIGVGIVDAIEAVGSGSGSGSDSGSLLQAADQSIVSLPGATDVLSGRMSNLILAEELNANEAIKSTSLASSIKESSTASSAVLSKQSEGEQEATAEVTVKLASTPAAAAESPADAAAESETKTVTVKKVVVVAEESADQADGNEIEEVVEEVVEEEEGEEHSADGGSATTTTVTVVTVKKTSDGSDAADGASASTANGSAETTTTTTTKTTTVHKSTTVEEPREEGEESEKPKVTPAIETTPPTPQAEEKPAVAVVEAEAEPKAAPKAEQTETNVEEEEDIEESVDSEDDEEEEASEVEDQNAQTTATTTTNDKPKVEDQVDSAEKATTVATESAANTKQAELNNQIKDIISDIDSNIKEEENIAHLKQQELALLKKQQELAKQIEQQQLLANQLAAQNQLKQQELQQQQYRLSQQQQLPQQQPQQQQLYGDRVSQLPRPQTELLSQSLPPQTKSSSYETYEESQNENGFTRKSFKSEESSNVSKTIDLRKIFTPATDAPEIVPKNRKLYASSAFYSPSLHPTVEDQVELARRISHSLSDISNHTSKGQSMYVNRKKRSVKWVHEGSGQEEDDLDYEEDPQASKENTNREAQGDQPSLEKLPLKLVMNPRGQMRDYNSVSDSLNIETGLLSPDNCAELISALQLQKGRGAELFAKRRRKAENWVVDETNAGTQSPSGLPDYQQYQPKPPTSPNLLPAYSDAGKHRVQLNLHQEQMIDKYAKPGLKVVKSPWEAALETGSASAAFVEDTKLRSHTPTPSIGGAYSPAPAPQFSDSHGYGAQPYSFAPTQSATTPYGGSSYQQPEPALNKLPQTNQYQHSRPAPVNPQRDLAYKPSIAQGWKAPGVELPRGLYVPKEIPLDSYAPPPAVSSTQQNYGSPSWNSGSNIGQSQPWQQQQQVSSAAFPKESTPYIPPSGNSYAPPSGNSYAPPSGNSYAPPSGNSYTPASNVGFPLSKPVQSGGFSSSVPPKQQLYGPTSYQKVAPTTSQGAPPVSFNPSPIPYEKLSKFENPDPSPRGNGLYSPQRHLNVRGSSRVRNLSPAPFGARSPVSYGSPAAQSYSPRPSSTQQQYGSPYEGGYDTGAPAQSGFSSANYAQGPTFNSTARGWGGVSGAGHNQQRFSQPKPAIASAGGLPYSDF